MKVLGLCHAGGGKVATELDVAVVGGCGRGIVELNVAATDLDA